MRVTKSRYLHTKKQRPRYTIWGQVTDHIQIADGVWRILTDEDCGFVLSEQRESEFRKIMPDWCSAYSTSREFEDVDATAIVLAFPDLFSIEEVVDAVEYSSTTDYYPLQYALSMYQAMGVS